MVTSNLLELVQCVQLTNVIADYQIKEIIC